MRNVSISSGYRGNKSSESYNMFRFNFIINQCTEPSFKQQSRCFNRNTTNIILYRIQMMGIEVLFLCVPAHTGNEMADKPAKETQLTSVRWR